MNKKQIMLIVVILILVAGLVVASLNLKDSLKEKQIKTTCSLVVSSDDSVEITSKFLLISKKDGTITSINESLESKYSDLESYNVVKEYYNDLNEVYQFDDETYTTIRNTSIDFMKDNEGKEVWEQDYIKNLKLQNYTCK